MNIVGVLLFSKVFTNDILIEANPNVMSNFGLLMILIWGFAYISVANSFKYVPWLSALFALEKLMYTITWIYWIQAHDLTYLYTKDLFTGIFYTIYGVNDFVFMLFFGWAFWISRKVENHLTS